MTAVKAKAVQAKSVSAIAELKEAMEIEVKEFLVDKENTNRDRMRIADIITTAGTLTAAKAQLEKRGAQA